MTSLHDRKVIFVSGMTGFPILGSGYIKRERP